MTNIVKPVAVGLLSVGLVFLLWMGAASGPATAASRGGAVEPDAGPPAGALISDAEAPPWATTDTARVQLSIEGMTCGSCATTARVVLKRVPGVLDARVSYDSASAVVLYDDSETSPDVFIAQLERMTGYEARVDEPAPGTGDASRETSVPE